MISRKNKLLIWVILVCFTVLQAISPFLHGHIDGSLPAQGTGLHMHADEVSLAPDDLIPTFRNATDLMHIVVVDKAVVKDQECLLPILLIVLFVFAGLTRQANVWRFAPSFSFRPIDLWPSSPLRAPPTL